VLIKFGLTVPYGNQGNVNKRTLAFKEKQLEYFQKVFLRRIQCGRIVFYVSKMTFQDGANRPPRRQSTKNIDFRRLADVNDDDEKEYFTVDIKKCLICQQIVYKNKSIQVRP